jgi:hypothetical protein
MPEPTTPHRADPSERRHDVRRRICHPVKIQCGLTGRFLSGRTIDQSTGGAMLELDHRRLLKVGGTVRVAIGLNPRQAVIAAAGMAEATVLRSLGMQGRNLVALKYRASGRAAAAG